jgi:hypothetical protein
MLGQKHRGTGAAQRNGGKRLLAMARPIAADRSRRLESGQGVVEAGHGSDARCR